MEKKDIKVAAQPHVHDLKFEEGKPLTFELHLELRPDRRAGAEPTASRSSGRHVAVTDEQLNEQLEQIRDREGDLDPGRRQAQCRATWSTSRSRPRDRRRARRGKEPIRSFSARVRRSPGIEELIMEAAPGETVERASEMAGRFSG